MTIQRRALAALPALLAAPALAQEAWPARAVTLVVPWAPGGSTDTLARLLAQRVAADTGQQILVDNRPGASGTVGHLSVARARPDGYTLLIGTNSTYAMAPHLLDSIPYDNDRAFAPLGLLAYTPQYMCVHPSLPIRDVAGLIAHARANPGRLSYSSSGAGSSAHLAVELFNAMAGIEMLHVPYRGGAPALQALMTNEVQFSAVDAVSALEPMRANAVRAIAVSARERHPSAPDVPTVRESGLPEFECSTDFALFAPAGLPDAVATRINAAFAAALRAPEVRARLDAMAIIPVAGAPGDFAAYQQRESAKWGGIIRARNIRPG